MASAPLEYTPEITEDFYKKLSRGIQQGTTQDVASARSGALERGLAGEAYEGSAVGVAQAKGRQSEADLKADIGFQLAGLQRGERMIGEERKYGTSEREASQAFSADQANQDRALRERLARMGYDATFLRDSTLNRYGYQQGVTNLGIGIGGMLAKGAISKFV